MSLSNLLRNLRCTIFHVITTFPHTFGRVPIFEFGRLIVSLFSVVIIACLVREHHCIYVISIFGYWILQFFPTVISLNKNLKLETYSYHRSNEFPLNCYRETVEVEKEVKEVEKTDAKDEVVAKKEEVEKNGGATDEKTENGSEATDKSVENGDGKEDASTDKEEVSKESSGT